MHEVAEGAQNKQINTASKANERLHVWANSDDPHIPNKEAKHLNYCGKNAQHSYSGKHYGGENLQYSGKKADTNSYNSSGKAGKHYSGEKVGKN